MSVAVAIRVSGGDIVGGTCERSIYNVGTRPGALHIQVSPTD